MENQTDKKGRRTWRHGQSRTPVYRVWTQMNNRCANPRNEDFPRYGARGISVCARWRDGDGVRGGFETWLDDVGKRPSRHHSLDRIDNDGDYEPGNVRWATWQEQLSNTRRSKPLKLGRRKFATLVAAASYVDMPVDRLGARLRRLGYSVRESLTLPKGGRRRMMRAG